MKRAAKISPCGRYREWLSRTWDPMLPVLLVILFNPSTADHERDDPTIKLLCEIASHNGYGGIVVTNAIPLRSSKPAAAIDMAVAAWVGRDFQARDILRDNEILLERLAKDSAAVLIAWGALGARCSDYMAHVLETVRDALPFYSELYCLGKTAGGHPKHPMARGKHKVPKNAPLVPWSNA